MGYGDEILAAGQAQRLYDDDCDHRRVVIYDRFNRVRWHEIWNGNPILVRPEEYTPGDHFQALVNGPNARPYIVYPFTEYTGWTFNPTFRASENLAKIYLTIEELQLGLYAYDQHGPYILIEPWSKHDNLRWPVDKWEELVASRSDLTFIQHVHKDSMHIPGCAAYIDASFRQACGLVAMASCYVRGESGMLHAAAALMTPSVAIWGGCMDWDVLGNYPLEVGVGVTPPFCGRYRPCAHCAETMAGIGVDAVSEALDGVLRQPATLTA